MCRSCRTNLSRADAKSGLVTFAGYGVDREDESHFSSDSREVNWLLLVAGVVQWFANRTRPTCGRMSTLGVTRGKGANPAKQVDRESLPVQGVHSNGVNSARDVPVQWVRSQARMRPHELL